MYFTYFKMVLFFLFDMIFLQWLKVIVSVCMRLLYRPKVDTFNYECTFVDKPTPDWNQLVMEEFTTNLQSTIDSITGDDDGFKYLSILLGSMVQTRQYCDDPEVLPESRSIYNKLLDCVASYIDHTGVIGRRPLSDPERYNNINFSGDMLSGLLYWLASEYSTLISCTGLRCNRDLLRLYLGKLFSSTTFDTTHPDGKKKPFLCFTNAKVSSVNPKQESGEKEDRGYIFRIFGLGPDLIRLLTWFKIGYLLTGQKRFKYFHTFLKIGYYPLYLANSVDYGMFFGRVMCLSWFTVHSNYYTHLAYLILTNDNILRSKLQRVVDSHEYNLDLQISWRKINQRYFYVPVNVEEMDCYGLLLQEILNKGSILRPHSLVPYWNVKKFQKDLYPDSYLSLDELGHKYVFENNPLKGNLASNERRSLYRIDYQVCMINLYNDYMFKVQDLERLSRELRMD